MKISIKKNQHISIKYYQKVTILSSAIIFFLMPSQLCIQQYCLTKCAIKMHIFGFHYICYFLAEALKTLIIFIYIDFTCKEERNVSFSIISLNP